MGANMENLIEQCLVTAGVDTHKDTHTVAALDSTGRLLGVSEFAATTQGYRQIDRDDRGVDMYLPGDGGYQIVNTGLSGNGNGHHIDRVS
jgi:transposase